MSQLQMISRGNGTSLGKVFFCCHPQEQETYLSVVAEELLQKQNCSVWYLPGDMERDAQFYEDLKDMQLFVMPVTKRLLTTENVGLEDFRFAVAHNIPVLPLMQEAGLEPLFNRVCGDLQCLSKFGNDGTAIDYDTKVTRFLESVLIGDALAEKIRAAFDAYVFLSYRKKDRRYAQELMRLIHRDPKCRDVAIWYDEFLIPGENFNDSIRRHIDSSKLFLLAVTPNLVNEENYVMRDEYPAARELGKKILPAELVETDKEALRRHYEGISHPIDPRNPAQLSDAMIEALGELAKRENDSSAEHRFFIGLAYLGGVDVEVDTARGAELILSAAKADYVPAMDKLVHMYRNGQGVKRSAKQMLQWKWRQTQLLLKELTDGLLEISKRELDAAYSQAANPSSARHSREDMEVEYERARAMRFYKQTLNQKVKEWLRCLLEAIQICRTSGASPANTLRLLEPSIRFLEKYADEDVYRLEESSLFSLGGMDSEVLNVYTTQIELLVEAHLYNTAEQMIKKLEENFHQKNAGTWQGRVFEATAHRLRTQMYVDQGEYEKAERSRKNWEQMILAVTAEINLPTMEELQHAGNAAINAMSADAQGSFLVQSLFKAQELNEAGKKAGELCITYGKVAACLHCAAGRPVEAEDAYGEIIGGLKLAQITDPVCETWAYLKMAGLGTEKAAGHLAEVERRLADMTRTDLRYLPLHRDFCMVQGDLAADGKPHYEEAFALAWELVEDMPTVENMEAVGVVCRKLCAVESAQQAQIHVQRLQNMIDTYAVRLKKGYGAEVLAGLYETIAAVTGEKQPLEEAQNIFAKLAEEYPQCLRYRMKRDSLENQLA